MRKITILKIGNGFGYNLMVWIYVKNARKVADATEHKDGVVYGYYFKAE